MNSNAVFGFVVMLISALSYGGVDVAAKVLGENLSPWQMTSGRGPPWASSPL